MLVSFYRSPDPCNQLNPGNRSDVARYPRHSARLFSSFAPASNPPLLCVLRKEQLKSTAEEPALRDHGALGQLSQLGGKLRRAEKSNLGLVGFAWRH